MVSKLLTRSEKVASLKTRVTIAKENLPTNYKAIIFQKFTKYDSNVGATLINNVVALRSTDEELTEILEAIANKNKAKSKGKAN